MASVGAHFPATEPFATFLSPFQLFPPVLFIQHSEKNPSKTQNPKIMLKWSSSPVRRLLRFFSTVRCPPGAGIGHVEIIRPQTPTIRPPTKVKKRSVSRNWCSFIGQITAPVKVYNGGYPGIFTFLEVKGPLGKQTTSPIGICISMEGELAQVALRYLQKKQYVFVSGFLCSYNKNNHVHYKVAVQELNFVRTQCQNEVPCTTGEELKNEEMALASSTINSDSCDVSNEERTRERHILWQIFFANPFEWWDQRATKRTSKHPDFKHKSTREVLWIRSDDPPWVKEQLNLYDTKMSEGNLFRKQDDLGLQGCKISDFVNL